MRKLLLSLLLITGLMAAEDLKPIEFERVKVSNTCTISILYGKIFANCYFSSDNGEKFVFNYSDKGKLDSILIGTFVKFKCYYIAGKYIECEVEDGTI
jgi:hypothetical protein